MTGTAMTEAGEFWKIYKLDVVAIPTNKPLRRINSPDLVYLTDKDKWDAIVERNCRGAHDGPADPDRHHGRGQVGKAIALLKRRGIKHELLNAKPENVAARIGNRGAGGPQGAR